MNTDHLRPASLANAVIISGPYSGRVVALDTDHSEFVADDEIAATFTRLAAQWRRETRYVSSVTKMALHPAYQRIIGLGKVCRRPESKAGQGSLLTALQLFSLKGFQGSVNADSTGSHRPQDG